MMMMDEPLKATPLRLRRRARAALAVRMRYALLPYLRSAFAAKASDASRLSPARHLALEFPLNAAARALSQTAPHSQWMLGAALLVAPAAATQLAYAQVFVPALQEGKWRFLYGGEAIQTDDAIVTHEDEEQNIWGHTVAINLETTRPVILIRPGFIVPQAASVESAECAREAVRGGIKLTASPHCDRDASCGAAGELLWAAENGFALQLHATAQSINLTWTGNSSFCLSSTTHLGGGDFQNARSKTLREGGMVSDSVEMFDVELANHGEMHENDVNAAFSQGTRVESWKTKEDIPDPAEDETYMLKELDVYGLPTEATTKLGERDAVNITVTTLDGSLLPDVVSRLFKGRLTLSSVHLDMCSDVGGIKATW